MAQRDHVPKFGNWESEDNVPYTVYFDKARQGRSGGKMINPNDPQENPDVFANIASPAQAPPPRSGREPSADEPRGRGAVRPTHELRVSKEDGPDPRRYAEYPAGRTNGNNESTHQRQGIGGRGRPIRQSVGSDHSIERSPLHARTPARGSATASPVSDGKNSLESRNVTPGRSRLKPTNRGNDTPDRGGAIPRFGEWDDKDPSSAENYTHIFNLARDEKNGLPKSPSKESEEPYTNMRKNNVDEQRTLCCFSWLRK